MFTLPLENDFIAKEPYVCLVERLQSVHQNSQVVGAHRFAEGVHCELSQTDIHGMQAYLSVAYRPQSASASRVGTVEKVLIRNVCFVEYIFQYRRRHTVGKVSLIGVMFDNDTFIYQATVGRIAFFGMVGVQSMGVVHTDEKTVCHCVTRKFFHHANRRN